MAGLPQSGVELVAQGASAYVGDIGRAASATDKFTGSLDKAGGGASAFSQIAIGALRHVGTIAVEALGQAAQAAGKFLADSVTSAADVEQIINVLGATSGATAAEMEEVRAAAIALGGDLSLPATSAQDAAEAMLELTKAGFSVDEAMAAAKGTLQLAAAAQISAGEAAAISAQAINAFGLEAADAARIADLLAGGANASSASMTDLAQGLQQGGFAFDAAGQTVDDLVVSLAALTNVGLTGSDAGTALKNAMMRLMNPTEKAAGLMRDLGIEAYDATGKMKPWPEVLENIRKATANMTDEERNAALGTIFLSDGMKAMIPLLDMSAEEYAQLTGQVSKAGSAQEVAGAQTKGFNGAVAGLQSQLETLQLIIGTKLLPLFTPLIQQVSEAVAKFASFVDIFSRLWPEVMKAEDPLATFFNVLRIATDDSLNPFIATAQEVITTIVGIGSALMDGNLAGAFAQIMPIIQGALDQIIPIIVDMGGRIVNQVQVWAQALGQWVIDALPGLFANLSALLISIMEWIGASAPGLVEKLAVWVQQFTDWALDAIPILLTNMALLVRDMYAFLGANAPGILAQLATWTAQFITWAATTAIKLIVELGVLLGKMIAWIIQNRGPILETLGNWAKAFADWIPGAISGLITALGGLWEKFKGWIGEKARALSADGSIGAALIEGIKKGINAGVESIKAAAASAAKAALEAAKRALGIQSPSKLFEVEVGYQIGAGIAQGIAASAQLVNSAVAAVTTAPARAVIGGGSTTVNNARTLNYSPSYGNAVRPSPTMDAAVARSLAL